MIMPYNNIKMEKEEQHQHPQEDHQPHENQGQVPNPLSASPTFSVNYANGKSFFDGQIQLPFDQEAMKYLEITQQEIMDSLQGYGGHETRPAFISLGKTYVEWKPISINFDLKSGEKKFITIWKYLNQLSYPVKQIPTTKIERQLTTTSTWDQSIALGLSYQTTVGINALFVSGEVSVGANLNASWGKSELFSETVTFGTQTTTEIEIPGGTGVQTVLSLVIGQATALITYQLRVRGNISAYFQSGIFPPSRATIVPEEDFKFRSTRQVKQTLQIDTFSEGIIITKEYPEKKQ